MGRLTNLTALVLVLAAAGHLQGQIVISLDTVIDYSVITVAGSGFNYPYGPISDASGTLTGTLASGDAINAGFQTYSSASIVLIPAVLGDMDGDGEVDGSDVDPFVDILLNGPYQAEADMNEDGEVNGLDVDPFVAAVVGSGTQPVDEPSSFLLCLVALGVVGGWWKWRRAA